LLNLQLVDLQELNHAFLQHSKDFFGIYIDTRVILMNNDIVFILLLFGWLGEIMPKVGKEYIAQKRQDIIAGTVRVCKVKMASEVTLRDVVKECGISQGSIYNYFSNIDEIFAEIINQAYAEHHTAKTVEGISSSTLSSEQKIVSILAALGEVTDGMIADYGAILYELNGLYARNPKRAEQFAKNATVSNDTNTALQQIMTIITEGIGDGTFLQAVPLPHILLLIETSLQGITRAVTFIPHPQVIQELYGIDAEHANAQGMAKILAQMIVIMLKAPPPDAN